MIKCMIAFRNRTMIILPEQLDFFVNRIKKKMMRKRQLPKKVKNSYQNTGRGSELGQACNKSAGRVNNKR